MNGIYTPRTRLFPSTSIEFQFPPLRTDIIFHLMCLPFLMSHDVNNEKCLKMKDDIKEAVWGAEGQCSDMILVQLLETWWLIKEQ